MIHNLKTKIEDLREYWSFWLSDDGYLDNRNGCRIHKEHIKNIQFDGTLAHITINGTPKLDICVYRDKTLELFLRK